VTQGGAAWSGTVTCFSTKDAQLSCTRLARWDASHDDPWLIVTDRAPAAADIVWYGLRPLIACSFKDVKRGGWHWEQTNMAHEQQWNKNGILSITGGNPPCRKPVLRLYSRYDQTVA
jgi:hypothetical protein